MFRALRLLRAASSHLAHPKPRTSVVIALAISFAGALGLPARAAAQADGSWQSAFPGAPGLALRCGAAGFYDAARDRFLLTGGGYQTGAGTQSIYGNLAELQVGPG